MVVYNIFTQRDLEYFAKKTAHSFGENYAMRHYLSQNWLHDRSGQLLDAGWTGFGKEGARNSLVWCRSDAYIERTAAT